MEWLSRNRLFSLESGAGPSTAMARYRRLRRLLLAAMALIALIPVSITAGLSYHQYKALLTREAQDQIYWTAESAQRTLEAFLGRLQALVLFVANEHTLDDLSQPQVLERVFGNLKKEHVGLVDLSVIDGRGIQVAYAGPYGLAGKDYRDSPWFQTALARRIHVSDVFMGFRNVPHFVIAVSKRDPGDHDYWVLRVSIDNETLEQFLSAVTSQATDDIFLVGSTGVLQTTSRYYGPTGGQFDVLCPGKTGITVTRETRGVRGVLRAAGPIRGTPWVLVLEQQAFAGRLSWIAFRNQLLVIVASSIVVGGLLILRLAHLLASRIRQADESRELAMAEAEHSGKLASIGRLAAGVAHEINNPLAIISEKAGLLKDILERDTEVRYRDKFLTQVAGLLNAVNRCRVITHRLLGFARRIEVRVETVQLNEVVKEVLSFLDKEALYRGITIDLDLDPDLPGIESDQGQLQQIFLNIINNAIDAVGQSGHIVVESNLRQGTVEVAITDDGPGMTPEVQKNIFEPFFTTKTGGDRKGTGLGLAITYGLVKKLGGKIAVKSAIGIGTTFVVSFPVGVVPDMGGGNGDNLGLDRG
ncbi:MAG: ATP-binding protein [Thermodesulfobacteriota bacterium]